ncbi:MAG: protein-L-isoaspartate(D-aspartate) O-methyltransferase [Actinomycetota bacterium]|nr:protein-L-isoaspartate(D-aspartate) O-methyltransferase [Actinomycetota bacterium]
MKETNNSSGKYHDEKFRMLRENMVENQIAARGISNKRVLKAFKKVPRHIFVGKEYKDSAYEDRPLPIGSGQTISQPYIVALMTESLELSGNEKVLEIGTGSGYQVAILAGLAKEVYTVEIIPYLYNKNKKLLNGYDNVKMSNHDGYLGWEEHAPYDRIIVTAAPEHIPQKFIEQLKDGGIMVIPVGPSSWAQVLYKVIKSKNDIKKIKLCDVAFVPLSRRKN